MWHVARWARDAQHCSQGDAGVQVLPPGLCCPNPGCPSTWVCLTAGAGHVPDMSRTRPVPSRPSGRVCAPTLTSRGTLASGKDCGCPQATRPHRWPHRSGAGRETQWSRIRPTQEPHCPCAPQGSTPVPPAPLLTKLAGTQVLHDGLRLHLVVARGTHGCSWQKERRGSEELAQEAPQRWAARAVRPLPSRGACPQAPCHGVPGPSPVGRHPARGQEPSTSSQGSAGCGQPPASPAPVLPVSPRLGTGRQLPRARGQCWQGEGFSGPGTQLRGTTRHGAWPTAH